MVIVDTSTLSLCLRRRDRRLLASSESDAVEEFLRLSAAGQVVLLGIIRQELLSGIRHGEQFGRLQKVLDAYDYLDTTLKDHDDAARAFNACRARGIVAGDVDMLICAVALREDCAVFTLDSAFHRYTDVLEVKLHSA